MIIYIGLILVVLVLAVFFFDQHIKKKASLFSLVEPQEGKLPTIEPLNSDFHISPTYSLISGLIKTLRQGDKDPLVQFHDENVAPWKGKQKIGHGFFFGFRFVATWDPDHFKDVYSVHKDSFKKVTNIIESSDYLMGKSVVLVEGQDWQRQRKILGPSFHADHLQKIVPTFAQLAGRLATKWEELAAKSDQVEPLPWMCNMTLDALGKGGFGFDFNCLEGSYQKEYLLYDAVMQELLNPLRIIKLYDRLDSRFNKSFGRKKEEFYAFLKGIIATRQKELQENSVTADPDILDLLVSSLDKEGGLSQEELIHNLFVFFIAGHETSSSALSMVLHFLANNPEVQDKTREEVLRVFGTDGPLDNGAEDVTYEKLQKLEYVTCVIKEAMRYYPPVAAIIREASKETVVGGYNIPEGTWVMMMVYSAQHDPDLWGDDVEQFKPERFLPENSRGRHAFAWTPFAAGTRACLGLNFAMLEMKTVVATLVKRFRFSPGPQPLVLKRAISTRPQPGYTVKFQRIQ
eukprot:TRINITY_DN5046_c0_g1_i1.p1 TRINITY_DN5046_c0_g1~~TRINITY_DN5046_c0_g1_i1.p1  ORF type:complete len:516 (-),score=92.09 TRINITY_DN5046_c0_g1_i1:41-1588(-)